MQARVMLPYLLQAETSDERARDAITFLNGWDGTIRGDSAQAAVYEAWYHQIPAHLFADELGDELWGSYSGDRNTIAMVLDHLPRGTTDRWCDDIRTQPAETCAVVLGAALADGLAEMAKRQGNDDFRSWRWDRVHQTQFPHQPLDESPLKPIFSRSIPNGGDAFTVNVAPIRSSDLYNQRHIPSYREIIDLSDLNASRFMFAPGQSGHFLSGNYSNLIERWQRVEYLPMRFDSQAIDAATVGRLVLEP
jgi:penicillin amidase